MKETIPASEQLLKIILSKGEEEIRQYFIEKGYNPEEVKRLIAEFNRYVLSGNKSLSLLSIEDLYTLGAEGIIKELLKNSDKISEAISRGYLRYIDYRKKIADIYQESKNWGDVFSTTVYAEIEEANEAFIDTIEETYQTKVKDSKHLSKLTGITNLYNYWDKEKGFLEYDEAEKLSKEQKKPLKSYQATAEQTRAEALRQLEETLIQSKIAKYSRALDIAIQSGAKYKDLLQIKPKEYGLPEKWKTWREGNQYNSILWAISGEFLIGEPGGLMMLPSLRLIAQEIDAPYSVVMDAHKLTR